MSAIFSLHFNFIEFRNYIFNFINFESKNIEIDGNLSLILMKYFNFVTFCL